MNSECTTLSSSKSLVVLYGENNLDMSSSKAILNATQTMDIVEKEEDDKWKHVEKCRGIRGNNNNTSATTKRVFNQSIVEMSDFKATASSTTSMVNIDHYYYYQRCFPLNHDYEEVEEEADLELEQFSFVNATCSIAKSRNFSRGNNLVQRMHFEAGLKNRLMNNYKKKSSKQQKANVESNQTQSQSFISSISTSLNSSEQQKTFLSKGQSLSYKKTKNNCSCCRLKQVSFHTTSSSTNTSLLSASSAPLATYLTFDVKMASTPILNKRKSFNFEYFDEVKTNMKQMSTPLTNRSVKRRFSSTKQEKFDEKCTCYPVAVNGDYKHQNRHRKTTSVSMLKRPKYSLSKKRVDAGGLRMHKNDELALENEIFDCNGYITNFIKKSSSSSREKKIQMKKRMQKMNNISTSTKKENTIVHVEKKLTRKQQKHYYEHENVRKIEDFNKRKTKTDFVKRIKLESAAAVAALATATHLPIHSVSENVLSFNNYFPNSGLNKFNQLGQLQVWFV